MPFAAIGRKWKLTFAGWSRQAKAAFHDPEYSFLPERRVSWQVRPLAASNGATAPGHKLPQKAPSKFFFLRSGERPVYGEQLEARYASQPRLGQNQTFSPPGELLLDELLHTETRRTALRVT